jgi:hypothetical protein
MTEFQTVSSVLRFDLSFFSLGNPGTSEVVTTLAESSAVEAASSIDPLAEERKLSLRDRTSQDLSETLSREDGTSAGRLKDAWTNWNSLKALSHNTSEMQRNRASGGAVCRNVVICHFGRKDLDPPVPWPPYWTLREWEVLRSWNARPLLNRQWAFALSATKSTCCDTSWRLLEFRYSSETPKAYLKTPR